MGARVLVTGAGGELGTRVCQLLEADRSIEVVVGMDVEPPRHRIRRTEFRRVEPRSRRRVVTVVREVDPTIVVHLGVYEPNARSAPRSAIARTTEGTVGVLGAAAESSALERIVVRSGIEIYGRRRGAATRPDESVPPDPTCGFGRALLDVERIAAAAGEQAAVPVTALRFAPLVGPHFPSPLGRYLRMPVVSFEALADPPFSLLHQEDAAAAVVNAARRGPGGPVNIVGPGAVTAAQAARMGGRIPVPITGPLWAVARRLTEMAGAPVPEHVHELLVRGRTADGSAAAGALGVAAGVRTPEVVKDLFEWASVTPLRGGSADAA
jgi:UDP-glucose 4-epimerase